MLQEQVPRMLAIVQIVGIVHYSLDVALVVAHRHSCLKYVLHNQAIYDVNLYLTGAKLGKIFRFVEKNS